MKSFKRKEKPEELNMDDHKWSVDETTLNDLPFYIRFNTSLSSAKYKEKFPMKVGFTIQFNDNSPVGLPTDEEAQELNVVEDSIIDLVQKQGVQALSLTSGGIREFIFYVQENTDIASIHQSLLNNIKTHEVHCMGLEEPNWDTYNEYTPS